ncbi:MAG: corrinoid protein [Anaerolineae bacterium]|jgi:corrinoid protein of di/trimethylamine methyltransferase|nr:corrinoid protein [Anaerolineae bacterium]MDH7474975.1 corrinoid protein [Anaerolineae bacterium]
MSNEELFAQMAKAIVDGDPERAEALARQALELGVDPLEAINRGFTPGINRVGELFASGEYFLPDLVIGGEAMKAAVAVLEPELARRQEKRAILGKVVIGTVEGDIHEIGKTLVATMLSANGFQVRDVGVDVSAEDFVAAVQDMGANLLGLSALLTTTMLNQRKVIEALQKAGLRDRVKVMVGGAPVTRQWAEEIGADGYAEDAVGSVALAKQLVAQA